MRRCDQPVSITIDDTNAGFTNQVFAYTIDPDSGAVSNIQTLSTDAEDDKGKTFTYDAAPGAQVGVGIVSPQGTFHSSGYGANVGLNSDGLEHTQGRGQGPDGQVTLGFEDLDRTPGNKPDDDFDDVVVTIDLGTSGASLDNAHYTYGSQTPETADDGDDSLHGGTGDDLIYGLGGNDTITGGDGGDTVHGGSGNDDIDTSGPDPLPDLGYPGLFPADGDTENDRDSVTGGAGNDTITTGDDKDTISGGTGNDSINAGLDDDDVSGGADDDTIVAGEGSDTVTGGTGDDLIYGGLAPGFPDSLNIRDDNPDGPDDLVPDNGRDLIDGGDGDDTIFGQDDDDTIFGGAGDDSIDAGIDDDLVFGGSGDDIVTGGQGADTLSGGDDRDTFLGATVGDDIDGGSGGDDYDTLDLTGSAPVGGSLNVIYDSNPENGTVEFFDDNGLLLGSAAFEEIENVIPCFTPGSLIATPKGERPVEELQVGDRVITRDNGLQEIRWIGAKTIKGVEMARNPALKPVLVRRGALGNGLPERDMTLSPNHRVLIANERAALYFDEREVLAAAKHLDRHGRHPRGGRDGDHLHPLHVRPSRGGAVRRGVDRKLPARRHVAARYRRRPAQRDLRAVPGTGKRGRHPRLPRRAPVAEKARGAAAGQVTRQPAAPGARAAGRWARGSFRSAMAPVTPRRARASGPSRRACRGRLWRAPPAAAAAAAGHGAPRSPRARPRRRAGRTARRTCRAETPPGGPACLAHPWRAGSAAAMARRRRRPASR